MYNCKINYILLNSKRKIKKKSINKVYFLIYDILLQRLRINVTRKPSRGVEDKLQIGTFVEQPLVWPQWFPPLGNHAPVDSSPWRID